MATVMAEFRAERERLQSTNGHRERTTRTPVLVVLAGVLATVARLAARRLPRWSQVRTFVMSAAGFACLTVAAFQFDAVAGWATLGVSLLVFEMLNAPAKQ